MSNEASSPARSKWRFLKHLGSSDIFASSTLSPEDPDCIFGRQLRIKGQVELACFSLEWLSALANIKATRELCQHTDSFQGPASDLLHQNPRAGASQTSDDFAAARSGASLP